MAQQRSHVPQFGNWDSGENVPYTVYFEKARKGRTGQRIVNPNDPQENPDMFPEPEAPASASPVRPRRIVAEPEEPPRQGAPRTPERQRNPPAEDGSRRNSGDSTHQRGRGENYRKSGRQSAGSENSFERSPLHNQARGGGGRDSANMSPSYDGKGLYKNTHGTPGRSRLKANTRGDESPEKGAAVPKFGAWDNNPGSADNYTEVFNQVRAEKNSLPKAPGTPTRSPYNPRGTDDTKIGCFSWCGSRK